MKTLEFLITTTILAISSSEPKYNFAPVITSFPLLLPVANHSQTVLFDMDIQAHQDIKTSILQNSRAKQSFLLLNTEKDVNDNDNTDFHVTNNKPNVIIKTTYLSFEMFDSPQWQFSIRSNWSLLYLVVTDDSKFKCENGTMQEKDFKLLENIMNSLWHEFQIMRVGVVFPFACKQKMVIYNGKSPSIRALYDRSIDLIDATNYNDLFEALQRSGENLSHDYPMLAGLFYRYPTSINDCENLRYYDVHFNFSLTLGFCGLDGMVMHDILTHFKFNATFCQCENCNYFGFGIDGNISGTLGSVNRNEMDISFNSRFMTLYSNEKVNYLHYVTTDTLCALVKKPDVVPLWHGVFNLLSPALWALIGAVLVAIGGITWASATINKMMAETETMTFCWYVYNSVTTTLVGYSPMKTKTLLMLRSACLMGSVFSLAVYQGHISKVYTTVERFESIKTLQDLYTSGVALYTSDTVKDLMRTIQNPEDKLQREFFDKAHLIPGDRLGIILRDQFAATVDRKSDVQMSILEQYSDDHGNPLIDIIDECFFTYYLTYIARTGFPFFEDILVFTERLNQAGLPSMYYKWTQQMLEIPNSMPDIDTEPRPFSKISLKDQCVAFGILFVGTIASVIVFAAEMWIGRHQRLKVYRRRSLILN